MKRASSGFFVGVILLCSGVTAQAQRRDSSAVGVRRDSIAAKAKPDSAGKAKGARGSKDTLQPPVRPGKAFFKSVLLPGWGQSNLGSHRTAVGMLVVEAVSIAMIRESGADDREARRTENDTIIDSYVGADGSTLATPASHAGQFGTPEVLARRSHIEDWAALLVANHLFSGADAFVEASLWDVKSHLTLHTALTSGGAIVAAAFHW